MTENINSTPPESQKPDLLDQLKGCLNEVREDEMVAWAGIGKREIMKAHFGGGAAVVAGLLIKFAVTQFVPDMWMVEGYGDFLAIGGLGTMGFAWIRSMELSRNPENYVPVDRIKRQRLN